MPTRLIVSTARAASLIAAAGPVPAGVVSAEVAAMTQRVLKMMLLSKIKLATAALVLISLVVTGVSLTRLSAHAAEPTNKPNPTDGIRTKPMKPSTARTLYLPDKLDHYADIDLPAHFKTLLAERSDNFLAVVMRFDARRLHPRGYRSLQLFAPSKNPRSGEEPTPCISSIGSSPF